MDSIKNFFNRLLRKAAELFEDYEPAFFHDCNIVEKMFISKTVFNILTIITMDRFYNYLLYNQEDNILKLSK